MEILQQVANLKLNFLNESTVKYNIETANAVKD